MRNKKLITILKTFSEEEWSELNSSIKQTTNKNTDVYKLFRYIYKHKTDLDSKYLIFETVKHKTFPNKNRKGFQNVISKLINIVEQFIKSQWLKKNKIEDEILIFEALGSRGLSHLAKLRYDRLTKYFKSDEDLGLTKNINQFRVNHLNRTKFESKTRKYAIETLEESIKSLISLSTNAAGIYQYGTEIYGQKNDILYEVLGEMKQKGYEDNLSPFIKSINSLTIKYNLQDYHLLYTELVKEHSSFSKEMQVLVHKLLKTKIAAEIKNGQTHLRDNLLTLHEYGIASGIYLSNNKLEYINFINIVSLAANLERFDWANEMIEKHSKLIDIKHRKDAVEISKIQILFHQKKYIQLNKKLSTAQFNSNTVNLVFRMVLVCCHFKIFREDIDILNNTFRNFKNFINTNKTKISTNNYIGSLNLCRILVELSKNYSKEYLRIELDSSKIIVYRTWLEKLYKEMESKVK